MIPLHGPQLAVAKGLVQFNEAMKPCKATQDRRVSVESSDKTRSTGEGNGSPLQYSCLDNPWTEWKGKKIWLWKMSPQVGSVQRATGQEQRALPTALRRMKGRGCSRLHSSGDEQMQGPDLRGRLRNYPKKKKHEQAMWLSEAYKYLRSGKQGRKGKTAPPECRVPEKTKER